MTIRAGLLVALSALVGTACARSSTSPRSAGEPTLRIALAPTAARAVVGGQAAVVATDGGAAAFRFGPGERVTLTPDGNVVRVEGAALGTFQRLRFASLGAGRFLTVGGDAYRGTLDVWVDGGALRVVNILPAEDYLLGVVGAEMGSRSEQELAALEAQAIVSRTYALRNAGRFGADGYDLQAGVADQVYGGVGRETSTSSAAVRRTAGRVVVYEGALITPFFHSTCGGRTAAPVEAFRSVIDVPYLRPVSDARGSGSYCDISPRYEWSVAWDAAALRAILARTVPRVLGVDAAAAGTARGAYVRRQGPSGRALEMRIRVANGEIPVFGPDVRTVLATPDGGALGSSFVRLTETGEGGLLAEGRGWGHGVGMCQWGAIGRARAGQDARTILRTYFPGADIARWY